AEPVGQPFHLVVDVDAVEEQLHLPERFRSGLGDVVAWAHGCCVVYDTTRVSLVVSHFRRIFSGSYSSARRDAAGALHNSMLRASRASLAVASARLRSHPFRPLLVVGGVALAFAMLLSVLGGSLAARQQAVGRALAAVPENTRGFRV